MKLQYELSEVHIKTGAELVSNGIVGRNLGTKQKVPSQVPPHNAIVDEFGTSLYMNFGKANSVEAVWKEFLSYSSFYSTVSFSMSKNSEIFVYTKNVTDSYFRCIGILRFHVTS